MSADLLREAAALMRERAEAATEAAPRTIRHISTPEVAEHIASWHPAVALAVADLLDHASRLIADGRSCYGPEVERALAVARAYLGSAS